MDHLHISKATIIGLSMGGRIAIDFALSYPEMIDKLVLANPGLSGYAFGGQASEEMWNAGEMAVSGNLSKATEMWLANPYMASRGI